MLVCGKLCRKCTHGYLAHKLCFMLWHKLCFMIVCRHCQLPDLDQLIATGRADEVYDLMHKDAFVDDHDKARQTLTDAYKEHNLTPVFPHHVTELHEL